MRDELSSRLSKTFADSAGTTYLQFRKGLTPRWGLVWRDIVLGWIALTVIISLVIVISGRSALLSAVAAGVGAVMIGFTIAYLMLFLHEAAHYNIHPEKEWNDLLCNIFVSGVVGTDVQSYRPIHWEHHRYFGGPMDTEVSYLDPLNVRFIVESLLGIRAATVMMQRAKKLRALENETPTKQPSHARVYTLLGGLIFNMILLAVLFWWHQWPAIISWILGVFVFFPFFGALRQLLEHRDEIPAQEAQTAQAVCVATNRIFGDGLVANTFGGAGFNRHLLHHWDPQISYSRLREVEEFFLKTEGAAFLRERRTTYGRTFTELFRGVRS